MHKQWDREIYIVALLVEHLLFVGSVWKSLMNLVAVKTGTGGFRRSVKSSQRLVWTFLYIHIYICFSSAFTIEQYCKVFNSWFIYKIMCHRTNSYFLSIGCFWLQCAAWKRYQVIKTPVKAQVRGKVKTDFGSCMHCIPGKWKKKSMANYVEKIPTGYMGEKTAVSHGWEYSIC